MAKKNKIYAVAIGMEKNGIPVYGSIYHEWYQCESVVKGVPGAIYKSFDASERQAAIKWTIDVLKANGLDPKTILEVSGQSVKPLRINDIDFKPESRPIQSTVAISVQPQGNTSRMRPVGDIQVSPLKPIQSEYIADKVSNNNADIQFDIICYQHGLQPDEVVEQLKRQFLNILEMTNN